VKSVELLDVGCGEHPRGNVNCDRYRAASPDLDACANVNTRNNFVQCDGQHLPFKDEAFYTVFSSHVIEHVDDPGLFLRELLRVSHERVTVKCPHRLSRGARAKQHKQVFDDAWFHRALSRYPHRITKVHSVLYALLFRKQNEMTIDIFKSVT
jgi:ubiquinone/menaquinone biosynthesis C-methylase UbiE